MSKNNEYRKLQSWDPKPEVQRAVEKEFYNKTNDAMRHKKKSDKKGKERSDHKHLYIRAEILDTFLGKEYSYVGKVCSVCGKIRRGDWRKEYRASFRGEKADATDLPKYIKIDRDYVRRKEL